ncbi:uncharacterized protein ACRADG_010074 [Cochliomyia hominivorax]
MHTGCRDGKPHNGQLQYPHCPLNAELIPLTDSDKRAILDFHNNQRNYVACGGLFKKYGIRSACRIGVMTWDQELEQTAFFHSSYCNFTHDICRNTLKYPDSGQNLGVMFYLGKNRSTSIYINVILYLWYIQYRSMQMDMIDKFYYKSGVVYTALHMLNERNNRVGCSCVKFYSPESKKISVMLTCNYPVTYRDTSYNSCREPASKCVTGRDSKYKFLCSSKESYDFTGRLNFVPFDGYGRETYECGPQAEMLHFEREGAEEVRKLDKNFILEETLTRRKGVIETTAKPEEDTTIDIPNPKPTIIMRRAGVDDEDIFTDYCKPGLCEYFGGDGMHTGCRDGKLHDGKFQIPPCIDPELIELTESDKQAILDFHNNQRNFVACGGLYKKFGLKPSCRHAVMTWDKELEKTAFLHSSYCDFAHDKCRNTVKYPFSGQNLGLMTINSKQHSLATYINIITYLWYTEYRDTLMAMIDSFYHQNEVMVGHFLTSLNERNNRVGCTSAKFFSKEKKKTAFMLSCNYPTTNIGKSTIYNSCKKPASKCVTGTDPKYKYLCSSKEKYDVSGKLKFVPYDGDGTEVFNCGRQAEMMHLEREGADEVKKADKGFVPDDVSGKATTTRKPVSGGGNPDCDGNPAAGGIPDYSEEDYDPVGGTSTATFHNNFIFIYLPIMVFLLKF